MNSIAFEQFYNNATLNIFSDASMNKTNGCYGVVAVTKDNIIDKNYRIITNCTNNNAEIKGVRSALSMANKWKNQYQFINIFSDSQISIFGLRDYIYKWKYNINDGLLYGTAKKPIINQEVFVECNLMLKELAQIPTCCINIYHQSGHVGNQYWEIKEAANVFHRSNNVNGTIDLSFIRYISMYNNYIDSTSRSVLRNYNIEMEYSDPISFFPKDKINKY